MYFHSHIMHLLFYTYNNNSNNNRHKNKHRSNPKTSKLALVEKKRCKNSISWQHWLRVCALVMHSCGRQYSTEQFGQQNL